MKISTSLLLMGGLLGAAGCSEEPISFNHDPIKLSGKVGDAMSNSVDLTVTYQIADGFQGLYLAFGPTSWLEMKEGEEAKGRREYVVLAKTTGMEAGTYEGQAEFWTGPSANSADETAILDVTLTLKP